MDPKILSNTYQKVADLIKKSHSILVITGAGISADSGLPTYRGVGGIYENQNTEDGLAIEDALSIEMFYKNPILVWKYIQQLVVASEDKTYNDAHKILAEIEKEKHRFWILTQNVDGFHIDAGSKNVIEIHGNLKHLVCNHCGYREELKTYKNISLPPYCPQCNHILKPDVVLFGELLPIDKITLLQKELFKGFDLYLVIGTSGVFPYIYEPIFHAIYRKIPTIEINPTKTIFSSKVNIYLPERASHALKKIWEYYK